MSSLKLDWKQIDTVLLDMDGTILDLYFDNYFWQEYLPMRWGEQHGLDKENAKRTLVPRFKSKEGTLSWYCLDYWTRELNIDVLRLKSDVEDLIQVRPHALNFMTSLINMGKRLIMVTNAHQDLITMKLERTGIGGYFSHIVCAHDLGAAKEHVEFWSRLNDKVPYTVKNTVLIDDNLTVLRAARAYGISHLVTIAQPDSRAPIRDTEEFASIKNFNEIFPD